MSNIFDKLKSIQFSPSETHKQGQNANDTVLPLPKTVNLNLRKLQRIGNNIPVCQLDTFRQSGGPARVRKNRKAFRRFPSPVRDAGYLGQFPASLDELVDGQILLWRRGTGGEVKEDDAVGG